MSKTVLDLDVGNSYTKWRLSGTGSARIENHDIQLLENLITTKLHRIRVSCVAEDLYRSKLTGILRQSFGCQPEFAAPAQLCAGVYNEYEYPEKLGIDRWLAGLAMWNLVGGQPCLIIDAGSALTIDTIGENGVFKGGYIIPGLVMMQRSLISNTGKIICDIGSGIQDGFGCIPRNTEQAVKRGASFAVISIVERSIEIFLQRYPHGKVAITGGDGAEIAVILNRMKDYQSDLVLDGLALALP